MLREELQIKIDRNPKSARDMREIGEAYLRGDVLRDKTAAEGWLMKAVAAEDDLESPLAMALIATEILGKTQVISDSDYMDIKKELELAEGEKRDGLERLLQFATSEQKQL